MRMFTHLKIISLILFSLALARPALADFETAEGYWKLLGQEKQVLQLLNLRGTRVAVVVGGVDMMLQALELAQRPHIVVGTPGRLADHLRSNNSAIAFAKARFLVIDEADAILPPDGADGDRPFTSPVEAEARGRVIRRRESMDEAEEDNGAPADGAPAKLARVEE